MNSRTSIRRHVASAVAAIVVSAFFVGAAVGPAAVQPGVTAQGQSVVA